MNSDNLGPNSSFSEGGSSDSPPEGRSLLKLALGSLFSLVMNLIVFFLVFKGVSYFVHSYVTDPITSTPQAVYVPIVNPVDIPGGYVSGIWSARMPNGDTCYTVMGFLDDTVSCVASRPE